jgi:hypothetical protein
VIQYSIVSQLAREDHAVTSGCPFSFPLQNFGSEKDFGRGSSSGFSQRQKDYSKYQKSQEREQEMRQAAQSQRDRQFQEQARNYIEQQTYNLGSSGVSGGAGSVAHSGSVGTSSKLGTSFERSFRR